jgi:protein TonB
MRYTLFYICLLISLAGHLTLIFLCRGDSGRFAGGLPIPVLVIQMSKAKDMTDRSSPSPIAQTSRKNSRVLPHSITAASPVAVSSPVVTEATVTKPEGLAVDEASDESPEEVVFAVSTNGQNSLPVANAEAMTVPLYAHNPVPEYPHLAKARGWEGEVLLRVLVGTGGRVLIVDLARSSGYPVLDRAAIKGVEKWRFDPARRGPLAVESMVLIPIPFILQRN